MNRRKLAEDAGMVFYFPDKDLRRFYMKNCHIPLDIAYIDDDYTIVNILTMQPEPEPKDARLYKRYPSAKPVRHALEVNAGWFARHHVKPGDKIDLERVLEGIQAR